MGLLLHKVLIPVALLLRHITL